LVRRDALERLRRAGDQPVAFAELRASGVDFPAAVVSELQLNGYAIDRVYERGRLVGVRLLKRNHATYPRHGGAVYGCGGSDNQRRTTNRNH
jgi:hypothetical protein